MQSPDHPDLVFVQAKGYTPGRAWQPPLWIVIHDMEAGESSDRAESTAAYFANPSDGRQVSSHYCVDSDSVVQCVILADTAWTVGNTPGNQQGINWELSGYARQTREEWLDPFGLAMFRRMAPYVRADAQRFGIPLRRCTVDDLLAYRPGITSHNDLRLAFGGTTHTDPGPAFPWDVFMQIITGEDDMDAKTFLALLKDPAVSGYLRALPLQYPVDKDRSLLALYREMAAKVDLIASKVDIDPAELAAIEQAASDGARAGVLASADDLAAALAEKLPGHDLSVVRVALREIFADAGAE